MACSWNPPCAACKFLRRKCQAECVFAAYFPPDQPQKFVNVHRIFGASNVSKLLNELHPHQREDAVNSLAYEAEMRLRDPINGCVGVISLLHQQLRQLQIDLQKTKFELARIQCHPSAVTTHVGNRYCDQPQQSYLQCLPQQLIWNFDAAGNSYVNVASFGQLSQLHQPSAVAPHDPHARLHPS
ncbi:hypothetical protein Fmac_011691 [Flemingia macrophylla]|uniref:LOB domain-containing protein n=1 Tax=Flemingia macrophylla TaxID=520843 RepID=A0ABD1MN59_9FABA